MVTFQSSTPVLRSTDYVRSRTFFTDVLGFSIVEEGGEPPRFGIFARDRATIFVNAWDGGPPPSPGGWDAYIHVDDVDALHEAVSAAGAKVTRTPEVTVYGMREFEIQDPDGNLLCFGVDAEGG